MKLGFVGTGTISEAIITGALTSPLQISQVTVSPRNAETAARLAARFDAVRIGADNQAVVDAADMLFLAIRPQIAEGVVRALRFRPGQHVVSLIAATERATLEAWIGVPVILTHAVPLPFVAERKGVTAIYPPDAAVATFFAALGTAVETQTKAEYDRLSAASALMGTYFGILETGARWLVRNGLSYEQAKAYLTPLFSSLSETAAKSESRSFADLRAEFSTRGGLNEQAANDFDRNGGTKAIEDALDGLLKRIAPE